MRIEQRRTGRRPPHRRRALWLALVLAVLLPACTGENSAVIDDLTGGAGEDAGDARFDGSGIRPPERATAPATAPPRSLVDAACQEGGLVVYESTPGQAMTSVLDAFREAYPCIRTAEHVRLPAAEIPLRIRQESSARRPTADMAMTSADLAARLHAQGLVEEVAWEQVGIPAELAEPYSVVTAASLYTIFYNTDLVPAGQAPDGWEDLVDPPWAGTLAAWSRPSPQALLVPAWGPERVREFTRALVDQGVTVYEDNPTVPQSVGAGEHPAGIVNYHAGVPVLESGAPVKAVIPDPLPTTLIHAYVTSVAAHPNAAQLFVNWLNTAEGSARLEAETNRGNALLPGTRAFELTRDVGISTYPASHIDGYVHWLEELSSTWR